MKRDRLDNIWGKMIQRCYNPNNEHYANYGGRRIGVLYDWRKSRVAFKEWANKNGYADNLTLDRIDNDGDYTPDNCRWVTRQEQAQNTRHCHYVEICGVNKCVADWIKTCGVSRAAFLKALNKGKDMKAYVEAHSEFFKTVKNSYGSERIREVEAEAN